MALLNAMYLDAMTDKLCAKIAAVQVTTFAITAEAIRYAKTAKALEQLTVMNAVDLERLSAKSAVEPEKLTINLVTKLFGE